MRKKQSLIQSVFKCGISLALSAGILAGCAAKPQPGPAGALPETIRPTVGAYDYSPEDIMYLSGVKAAAEAENVSYSLCDVDEDEISELFLRDEAGNIAAYQYDAENRQAKRTELTQTPEELSWVGSEQWADGSIIGVAMQTGDPGVKNDYYLSANYAWLSEEQIGKDGGAVSGTDELELTVAENREAMFADAAAYQGEDIQRLRDYYALATNWDRRNAEGVEPVKKYLDAAYGVTTLPELTALLTDPERDPFSTMLRFTVTLDLKDTSHWAVELTEDEFSVLPRVYHNYDPEEVEVERDQYDEMVRHVLTRAGYDEETVGQLLADSRALEDQLLPLAWLDEETEESAFRPFDDVVSECENFPLRELLNAYQITEGSIRAYFPKYLQQLDELYTAENLPMLKAYIMVHTAAKACGYLDYQAATCLDEANGTESSVETLNRGYLREAISPRGLLSVAEENAYMTHFVSDEVRADLTELAEEIRAAFREMICDEDWMSDEGKVAALEKLDSMTFCVMSPDKLIDSSYLAVDPEGCFLDEYAKLRVSSMKHNGAFAGKERIPGDWRYDLRPEIATTYTNAFYYGSFNQFFILAGFVNDSVYSLDMPKEEKLAKLGEIVGHELTHGFDPLGIRYDKDGNLVGTDENPSGWLPEADYKAFGERAQKVVEYFDAIRPFPYDACSGAAVQGEAIADMGGLSIALKIAEGIDGFDYDAFFRSHAQLWRLQTTLDNERSAIYNEHPLCHLRINTVVQQFDEFYETYGVSEGDGMYLPPESRIAVW